MSAASSSGSRSSASGTVTNDIDRARSSVLTGRASTADASTTASLDPSITERDLVDELEVGGAQPPVGPSRHRDGAGDRAGHGVVGQWVARRPEQRGEAAGGGQEGSRGDDRARLDEEEAEVDRGARRQLHPLAEVPVEQIGRHLRLVGHPADDGGRALAGEERPGGVDHERLLVGEPEVHRQLLRQTEHAGGDDVALDLRCAPTDGRGQAGHPRPLPAPALDRELAVDHRQVRSLQVQTELVDPLPELGDRHLHVAVLGGRRSLRERGEALVAEGPQRPDPHRQLRDLAAHDRIAVEAGGLRQPDEVVDATGRGHHALHPQPTALVGQRPHRDPPAVVDLADEVLLGHDDVGEEHLGELGPARDVTQRAHLEARACPRR